MTTTKKHILIVTSEFPPLPGGIGNHIYNVATFLSRNQYNVQVIADQRADNTEEENFDRTLTFDVHRVKLRQIRIYMYFKRIVLLFKKIKSVDVVLATGKFPLWIVALVSFFYKKEYVAVIHGSEVNFRNYFLRSSINSSLRRFSKIIAVSNYTKSLVSKLKLRSVKVIPNGFDASIWETDKEQSLKLKGNPVLLTVGNVTERKGQMNVIKHFPDILKKFPNAHYHCIGFPTEKEAILKVATKLNVARHITFHGRVKHGDLRAYLTAADVFCNAQ